MRRWTLPVLLALGLAALAIAVRSQGRLPETPEKAVNALFDAAGRGDSRAYRRLVGPSLRRTIERTGEETGLALDEELRQTVKELKGLAMTRVAEPSGDRVEMDVELVFADRNERQRVVLRRSRGGWLVESIHRAEREEPVIPYGTPVFQP